jgi:ribosomal protein S27E
MSPLTEKEFPPMLKLINSPPVRNAASLAVVALALCLSGERARATDLTLTTGGRVVIELVSSDAAVINQAVISGKCPNCGAPQVVGGKGVIRCEYCGAEFFIPKSAAAGA